MVRRGLCYLAANACRGLGVTICCLGPVATGTVEQPRTVYGASGLQSAIDSGSNRLSDAEAAAWLGAGVASRPCSTSARSLLHQVWLTSVLLCSCAPRFGPGLDLKAARALARCAAKQCTRRLGWPTVSRFPDARQCCTAGYAMQYLPSAAMLLLKRIGPARSRALKSGKSGYNLSELAKASRSAEK